jgi:DNA-binding NarL/FixJ family response regulator
MTHYLVHRDWDAALELIERFGLVEGLHTALPEGLDELLETARISTVEAWCDAGERFNVDSPYIALARAEIALRRARFTEAQTHAEAAAFPDSHARYRALCLAGRAAHMASREEEAAELYRQAEASAATENERREARWCEVICLIDMEDPDAANLYSALRGSKVRSDPSDLVRSAVTGLAYQLKFGPLDLTEADGAYELLRATRNSIIQTSFLSIYGVTLAASARYDEARAVAQSLVEIAQSLRLEFAAPFAHATAAAAEAGSRRWDLAQAHVDLALKSARNNRNVYAEQVSVATAIRLLSQQGRYDDALALPVPAHHSSLPAGAAEVLASRALALAAASRIDEVPALLADAERLSSAMEPRHLALATKAVAALKSGASALDRVHDVASQCLEGGTIDILVTAYRSAPALLQVLLKDVEYGERVARVVARVGDQDLADAVGQPLALDDPRARLSKRELEVLAMLEQGLSNRQIAQTLVISEKTAKVHVHRIYDKLGVRSRRDIAVQALLRRTDHATSAMGGTDESAGSSLL